MIWRFLQPSAEDRGAYESLCYSSVILHIIFHSSMKVWMQDPWCVLSSKRRHLRRSGKTSGGLPHGEIRHDFKYRKTRAKSKS